MNEFIKAEKSRISGMLASYTKQVDDITNEMLGIDAKYKALAKKEKEALSSALSVLKDLIKGASKMYAMLGEDEEKTEEKVAAPVIPDDKTQVVDTLFPENNEPEEGESAPAEDGTDPFVEKGIEPKFDSAGFTTEDNIPPVEEEKPLDLANMKQDDTIYEFEKDEESLEEVTEEEEIVEEEEEEEEESSDSGWDKISQW